MKWIGRPVEQGEEYEVLVEAKSARGDGIAHIEGFVIFIPGAPVGQKIKIKIKTVKRTFAVAEIL
ncbi:MAG: TRAM domain-containing protein [Candidatus Micrarchaeota archaeon]|nr:TRAM domain-containing protein [Candidatus Micrarchaeota archaeon]